MTEVDFKNLRIIEDLVSRHFSLSSESLNIFKQRLYEPETDPYIQKIFGDSKDFRIHFPVTDRLLERFDQGWKLFFSYFKYFVQASGMDYSAFRSNKVTFKRQAMKLKKAIIEFYIEDPALCNNFLGIDNFNPKDSEDIELLEDKVMKLLDKVGISKLPGSGMEIVVTLNFADWFISSTGENWTSCLNLESNFAGCFWSGLPGLVIDKNRIMIYISNGIKKNYHGIVTESVLSRSWAMLDSQDHLNIVRYFPAEKISTQDIRTITGLPFSNNRDWVSKHPLNLLTFDENKTAFIYLDFSRFHKYDDQWYIEGHEAGRYGFINKSTEKLVENIHIFDYKGGLGKLIEARTSLGDVTKYSCAHCGETFVEELIDLSGHRYCNNCLEIISILCAECGTRILRERGAYREVTGGNLVCEACFNRNYEICENCGCASRKENVIKLAHGKFCKFCLDSDETVYRYCMTCRCGSIETSDDYEIRYVTLENNETICHSCLKKEMDKGQYFLELPDPKKNSLWRNVLQDVMYTTTTVTTNPYLQGTAADQYRVVVNMPPQQVQQDQLVGEPLQFEWNPAPEELIRFIDFNVPIEEEENPPPLRRR